MMSFWIFTLLSVAQAHPVFDARTADCQSYKERFVAFQKKYDLSAVLMKKPEAFSDAEALLRKAPVLSRDYLDHLQDLAMMDINKDNVRQYLADLGQDVGNRICSGVTEILLFKALTEVHPSKVKDLWKEVYQKRVGGPVFAFAFLGIYNSASELERAKLLVIKKPVKETFEVMSKFVKGAHPPKSPTGKDINEEIAFAKYSQERLKEELRLEPQIKSAIEALVFAN